MNDIIIRAFRSGDEQGVFDVILPIQQEEFGVPITAADQPDLAAIPDFYQQGKGGFWVAEKDGHVVGTISLKDIGDQTGALRKMFVAAEVRGKEFGVAARLLQTLIAHAEAADVKTVVLGTTEKFLAAHRFYEKNGFVEITAQDLPESFPRIAVDTKFYQLAVAA